MRLGLPMKVYEVLIAVFLAGFIIYMAAFYGRDKAKVYVCHEVTKQDPKDVQDICKKAPKYQ